MGATDRGALRGGKRNDGALFRGNVCCSAEAACGLSLRSYKNAEGWSTRFRFPPRGWWRDLSLNRASYREWRKRRDDLFSACVRTRAHDYIYTFTSSFRLVCLCKEKRKRPPVGGLKNFFESPPEPVPSKTGGAAKLEFFLFCSMGEGGLNSLRERPANRSGATRK